MSNSSPHALHRVLSLAFEPWALTAPMVKTVALVLSHRLVGHDPADPAAATTGRSVSTRGPMDARHAVAVIPVHGLMAPRANLLTEVSGSASYEDVGRAVDEAVADASVGTIVLDIDSPGGSVLGATELAQRVRRARDVKPIIACAYYQMCSAAYWIGACATEVVASPSSVVGSIGVYTIHNDLSAALEQLGVKVTFISAGKYKVDGIDGPPLSESARARLQTRIDAAHARFIGDVAAGRRVPAATVRAGFGEGAIVEAADALALGMIDRVEPIEETIARVQTRPAIARPPEYAALAALRRRSGLLATSGR